MLMGPTSVPSRILVVCATMLLEMASLKWSLRAHAALSDRLCNGVSWPLPECEIRRPVVVDGACVSALPKPRLSGPTHLLGHGLVKVLG